MKFETKIILKPIQEILQARGLEEHGRAQKVFDSEVVRLCRPYIPYDTHTLQNSAEWATDFGSGLVVYSTPYARVVYYTHRGKEAHSAKKQDPRAGKLWFERMKQDHMDDLKRVIARETGGKVV